MAGHTLLVDGQVFLASVYNAMLSSLHAMGVKLLGRGVLEGLELTPGTGFDLEISAGWINAQKTAHLEAITYELPDSVTRYIWVDETGDVTLTADTTYPGGDVVCLGEVVTDGSGIDEITEEGRMLAWNWPDERTAAFGMNALVLDNLNNFVGVGKVPDVAFESAHFMRGPGLELGELTVSPTPVEAYAHVYAKAVDIDGLEQAELHYMHETAGEVQLYLGAHKINPFNVETISATKVLTARDANIQRLTPTGSHQDVELPDPADIDFGHWFEIANPAGSGFNLVVKTLGGGSTIETIVPGDKATIRPVDAGGSAGWPDTAVLETEEDPV